MIRTSVAVTALGAGCLWALNLGVAHGCASLACTGPSVVFAPTAGQIVPANSPGLAVQRLCGTVEGVALLDEQGIQVLTLVPPTNTGELAVTLNLPLMTPLTPGESYTLRAGVAYPSGSQLDAQQHEAVASFTAGPASPLPDALGTIRVAYGLSEVGTRRGQNPISPVNPRINPIIATVAQLSLEAAPELAPFAPLISYTTSVDGTPWAGTDYGQPFVNTDEPGVVSLRDVTRIHASCGRPLASAACEPEGVSRGRHTVLVQAHLGGSAIEIPPVSVEIDLQCPSDGGVEGDATVNDGGAAALDALEPLPAEPASASPQGGCALASVHGSSGWHWSNLAVAGITVLVACRRRRLVARR